MFHLGPPLPPNMLPRMPPSSSQSNNGNQSQPPPLMSLNPFTENARDNSSRRFQFFSRIVLNCLFFCKDHRSSSNAYDNFPPSLMFMSTSHYDNNNSNQYDDYRNSQNEQTFDLHIVTDEIPYFDLPAGLMCLLVKVKSFERESRLFLSFVFAIRMKIVIIIHSIHRECVCHHRN